MREIRGWGSRPFGGRSSAVRRWRRLADEHAEANVYRDLAARRSGEEREILLRLAEAEERHAAHWQRLLSDDGKVLCVPADDPRVDHLRTSWACRPNTS